MSILHRVMSTKEQPRHPRAPKSRRRFFAILRITIGAWLKWKFQLRRRNVSVLRNAQPPYLVIPNHVGFWDPFLVGLQIPRPVHYLVADSNFRNPLLRFLLTYIEAIPKTKSRSDMKSFRTMMGIRNHGGVICLFPEGRRTWDGRSLPPIQSTAKLIKVLKIPVIVPLLEGMYLSNPCWSPRVRRGPVTMRFTRLFEGPELRGMSVDEIDRKLATALDHDEYAMQRKRMNRYSGKRRAEYLERVLHTCPACTEIGTTISYKHSLQCNNCGYTVELDEYGFLQPVSGPLYFEDSRAWNEWQIRALHSRITNGNTGDFDTALFSDSGIQFSIGFRSRQLKHVGFGTMRSYRDRLEFLCRRPTRALRRSKGRFAGVDFAETDKGLLFVFPLSEISGWNVQNHEHFEWYHKHKLYHVRRVDNRFSGYKWYSTINLLLGRHPQAAHMPQESPADAQGAGGPTLDASAGLSGRRRVP